MVDQDRLKQLYSYDNELGVLRWKNPTNRSVLRGSVVGSLHSSGYMFTTIARKMFSIHRLIFILHHGYNPENDIDHINGIKNDNRIENLREVSVICNLRNSKLSKLNRSGVKGVYWKPSSKRWVAEICDNYKSHFLGYYKDLVEASYARLAAEQCLGWNSCDSTKREIEGVLYGS